MKAFLMERGRAFALEGTLPPNAELLVQDLELELLLQAMAQGDEFVLQVARQALMAGTRDDIPTILYRQAVLKDCLEHPALVKELYAIAVEAIAREGDWRSALFDGSSAILQIVGATGCALLSDGQVFTFGDVPATHELRAIANWLEPRLQDDVFATTQLGVEPQFAHLTPMASGVLAAAISLTERHNHSWRE